jgi:hypothetical protein
VPLHRHPRLDHGDELAVLLAGVRGVGHHPGEHLEHLHRLRVLPLQDGAGRVAEHRRRVDQLLLGVAAEHGRGLLGGEDHEPVGHDAAEPGVAQVALVDPVAVDGAEAVAAAADDFGEPVEEVGPAAEPAGEHEGEHDEHGHHREDRPLVPAENVERAESHCQSSTCGDRFHVASRPGG